MYFDDEKNPKVRVGMMSSSVAEFLKAIDLLQEENVPVYSCQAKFARTLFNQNSLRNNFAQQGQVEYPHEMKDEIRSTFSATWKAGLRGAITAGDQNEIKALREMQELPFV